MSEERMSGTQRYVNWQTVIWLTGAAILAVVGVIPLRGCARDRVRKVSIKIEFMPEDAAAVSRVLETLRAKGGE